MMRIALTSIRMTALYGHVMRNYKSVRQMFHQMLTGRPEVKNEDNCSLVAVQYVDELFDIVPDACFKILRRWTVLDWCQYDPSIGLLDGRWEYVQIILVNDSEEPTGLRYVRM